MCNQQFFVDWNGFIDPETENIRQEFRNISKSIRDSEIARFEEFGDEVRRNRNQDWSILANKVVGSEL